MDEGAVVEVGEAPARPAEPCATVLGVQAAARADYIAELCAELEAMARAAGETVLATLFRMARAEALRIATQSKAAGG